MYFFIRLGEKLFCRGENKKRLGVLGLMNGYPFCLVCNLYNKKLVSKGFLCDKDRNYD